MIINFDTYNESLRDKMKPKSDKEMMAVVSEMRPGRALNKSLELDFVDIFKKSLEIEKDKIEKLEYNYLVRAALYYGSLKIVKYLVNEKGFRLRADALSDAAERGYLDIVKYLVEEKNKKVNVQDDEPLDRAIRNEHMEIIEYLISKGANPNAEKVKNALKFSDMVNHYGVLDYFKQLNEGIIDHMTPKSEKQLKNAFISLFNKINPTPVKDIEGETLSDLIKIVKIMDSTIYGTYLLTEDDDDFDTMFEVFESLVIGRNISKSLIKLEKEEYNYNIYTDIKMALGTAQDFNSPSILIFDWGFLRKKITTFQAP